MAIVKSYQNIKSILAIGFLCCFVFACAPKDITPAEETSYITFRTLAAAKEFRHTGLSIAAEFYKQGLIHEELKKEIIIVADQLQDAINKVADALTLYIAASGQDSKKDLTDKIVTYQRIYGKFSDLVMPYLLGDIQ